MNRTLFRRSLLATIISAMAVQAHALEYDLGNGYRLWNSETVTESLNLTGQRNQQSSADKMGVEFTGANIQGSLISQGNYFFSGLTRSSGITMDPFDPAVANSVIAGDLINKGNITLSNVEYAEGIEIGKAMISGSIINAGNILITAASDNSEAEGVYLHGTTIGKDFVNSGTIDVRTPYATGLILDRESDTPVSIGGKLINTGLIRAQGYSANAFDIEAPTSPLRIENQGTMEAIGDQSFAVVLYDGQIESFSNSGTIRAARENSKGIVFKGATFANNAPPEQGIINTGLIEADGTAIEVTGEQLSPFAINQRAGLIKGGQTAINGGSLATLNWTGGRIDGDVLDMAAVNVLGSAQYSGKTIAAPRVDIASGGSLNLEQAGSSINGDLQVASGGTIDMRLSNAVDPRMAYLTVNGKAAFASGSSITLSAKPQDFTPSASGTQYTLVKAAQVQDNGLRVASASSLLKVDSYATDARTVNAVVSLKEDKQVDADLANVGASQNARDAVNNFKNSTIGGLTASDPVFKAFANAGSEEALARLAERLSPEVNRGSVQAAVAGQNLVNSTIGSRVRGMRSGLSSGDVLTETGVWVQGLSNTSDQDQRDGVAGYSANSSGIAVGADGRLNERTTVGVAYSYLNSNVTSDTGNKTDVKGNAFTLYGSYDWQNWFVDGSLTYGRNDNDGKRYIADTVAKGSYDSELFGLNALAGYSYTFAEQWLLEPRVAARYSNVKIDGYSEKGSSAALRNNAQRYEVGELGAGLRVAADFPLAQGNLQPEATLMAYHDFIGDRVSGTSSFLLGGTPFVTTGASPVRDTYEAGVGVNYQLGAVSVGANYNYTAKTGYQSDTFLLKARYAF